MSDLGVCGIYLFLSGSIHPSVRGDSNNQSSRTMFVFVEGNIGSGKSTFLEIAKDFPLNRRVVVLQERVAEWMSAAADDDNGNMSIFDRFYQDKRRFAFVFQSYILLSRVSQMMETLEAEVNDTGTLILCERSFMTDLEVFVRSLAASGDMTPLETSIYERWHAMVRKLVQPRISLGSRFNSPIIIYLRASPETSFQRIGKRARRSEDNISQDYIRDLHARHDAWLMSTPTGTTLVVDANRDFVNDRSSLDALRDEVVSFLHGVLPLPEAFALECRNAFQKKSQLQANQSCLTTSTNVAPSSSISITSLSDSC